MYRKTDVCFVFMQRWNDSASLASLTRETGPKVVRGDPASKSQTSPRVHQQHVAEPAISASDSSLKFTHVLYNLSPAGNDIFELIIKLLI
jgi:phosphoenolpyruvate carboxykinase (ATP)